VVDEDNNEIKYQGFQDCPTGGEPLSEKNKIVRGEKIKENGTKAASV
jgi:hypothetical protein